MTLIVARAFAGKIYILGDSALTSGTGKNLSPVVDGCIKQYIVNKKLAIAFAGNQIHFESICATLLACNSRQECIDLVLAAHAKGLDVDLLVAEAEDGNIAFIRNGSVSVSPVGFIGHEGAYKAYLEYFHAKGFEGPKGFHDNQAFLHVFRMPSPIVRNEIYPEMFSALKKVILDRRFNEVGGFVIPLCTVDGEFQFMVYAESTSGALNMDGMQNRPKPIDWGTAETGGNIVEFCENSSSGGDGRTVGLYYHQGGFGVVFCSNQNGFRHAKKISAQNPAFWELETHKQLGNRLRSSYLSPYFCMIAAEKLQQSNQFEDSIFCYELCKESVPLREEPDNYDRYLAGYATAMFNAGKQLQAIAILSDQSKKEGARFRRCTEMLGKMLAASRQ